MTAPLLTAPEPVDDGRHRFAVPAPLMAIVVLLAAGVAAGAALGLLTRLTYVPRPGDMVGPLPLVIGLPLALVAGLMSFVLWDRAHDAWLLGGLVAAIGVPLTLALGPAFPLGLLVLGLLLALGFARVTVLGGLLDLGLVVAAGATLLVGMWPFAVLLCLLVVVVPTLVAPAPRHRLETGALVIGLIVLLPALLAGYFMAEAVLPSLGGLLAALLPTLPTPPAVGAPALLFAAVVRGGLPPW